MTNIRLIVGLGNPGTQYVYTRHNAGFWFIDMLAQKYNCVLSNEGKFFADVARFKFKDNDIYLLKPQTYMNLSGKSLLALAQFYKILPNQILVAHDELDFAPGVVKLKQGGGNGGHNGLKDIDRILGKDYWRIRLGIGHPGDKNKVADYVLKKPSNDDEISIHNAIDKVLANMELILLGQMAQAMKNIHTE